MLVTILVVLLLIDLFVFTALDRYVFSLIILLAAGAAAWFFVPAVSEYISSHHWTDIAVVAGAYLAVGAAVAFLKWVLFLFSVSRWVSEQAKAFNAGPQGESESDRWSKFVYHLTHSYEFTRKYRMDDMGGSKQLSHWGSSNGVKSKEEMLTVLTPVASDYVTRISMWVFQWPFVVIGSLLEDILLRFGEFVSEVIGALFGRLGRMIMRRAVTDI